MNELEARAQAAYQYVTQLLHRTIDDCANLRAELAARDAQMKALQGKLAETEAKLAACETQLAAGARTDAEAQ